MTSLSAAPPLESAAAPVGRRSTTLIDRARDGRALAVDIWYPARSAESPLVVYELLPGIAFRSAGAHVEAPVADGAYPLLVFSHGRTGIRFNYSLLCEALAARGAVVVSADHPGDVLFDWLGGTFVDDRTNETNRVADSRFLIDSLLSESTDVPVDIGLRRAIDGSRIATVGHSYGAYTGLASVAGVRGVPPDDRVCAVIGLQPYTRTMSDSALARVAAPTLLILSELDVTAPPATDGERPWSLIPARPLWRLDLGSAAHHASSDMGLYLELAEQIHDLPPMVTAYVTMMRTEMTGPHLRPWREGLFVQLETIWAFLDVVLPLDPARGERTAARVESAPNVRLQRLVSS